jgi:hypothetical protein
MTLPWLADHFHCAVCGKYVSLVGFSFRHPNISGAALLCEACEREEEQS